MKQSKITLLTFGYEGWGNHTKKLVSNIDRSEQKAGYAPPLFVDIRFRRAVRAKGFVSNRFCELVGTNRYKHMKSLGNARIGSGLGGIKIHEPRAAAELLDAAFKAAECNRRVVYFCSCGAPIGCHRRSVARLLRNAGKKQGVEVRHIEWPGGEPVFLDIEVSRETFAKAEQDRAYVPLPRSRTDLRALPWYSVVNLRSRTDSDGPSIAFFTGPASFVNGAWCLPVWENGWKGMSKGMALKLARKWRERDGYAAY